MKTKLTSKDFYRAWRSVYSYLTQYRGDIIFLSVIGVLSAFANGVLPLLTGRFFDAIIKPGLFFQGTRFQISSWVFLLMVWFTVQILANISDWLITNKARYIGLVLQGEFMSKNMSRVLFMPISFHKKQRTGELGDAISKASWQLGSIVQDVLIPLSAQFLSIIIGLIISLFISPFVGFLLLFGMLVYVYLLFRILPESVSLQEVGQKAWNSAYDDAYQALTTVHAVKQATAEKHEERNLKKKFLDVAVLAWYKIEQIWNKINFSQKVLITLVQLCIFVYLAKNVYTGNSTIGDLIALVGYASMVFQPFTALGRSWQTMQGGLVSLLRAESLLNVAPEKYVPDNAVIIDKLDGGIEFQNVSFGYSKKKNVLENVSFKVNPGEVVALVGESGVGKTTLMELLSGYYFPNKGKVLMDGHNIKKLDLTFLRQNIAVVPQETVLFNDSVLYNIKYGKFSATKEEVYSAAMQAQAHLFIEKFEKKYEQEVGERGVRLSVGQKQRISIARAILRDPKILILDEPTSALDSATEQQITLSLEKLMKGRTTFIIAHRLSTVRKADKIFVLENGTITEAGSHEELIQKEGGAYRKLYELHIGLE